MSDKLVILAAGLSSRMRKMTGASSSIDTQLILEARSRPKSMLSIGNKGRPFIDYLIYNATKSGIKEILIVVGEKDETIKNYYSAISQEEWLKKIKISFATQHIPTDKTKPQGTADALLQGLNSKPDWKGEKFLICNSDNLYSQQAFLILTTCEFPNSLIDYDRNGFQFDKSKIEDFAITVKNDQNYLTDIIEKPDKDAIEKAKNVKGFVGVSMNLFLFSYDMIMPYLIKTPFSSRLEKEIPTAVKMMINDNPKSLYCYPLSEHVPDLTSMDDISIVKNILKEIQL